ncbi:hypothetical protein [Georgenia sunbinii]|uniref:hypothetical protein n=1 Tax=Georgenia sunbinii TaxID=3117728 RepID=UPI002F26A6CA
MSPVRLRDIVAAELDKLRTLPLVAYSVIGTILTGGVIAAALAAADGAGAPASALDITLRTVPFVHGGLVLLGVLPAGQEYDGRQLRMTLAAMPHRGRLATGKTVAALVAVMMAAAATVAGCLAAARLTQVLLDVPRQPTAVDPWSLAGAVIYLAVIGVLAHAAAMLLRHVMPALTVVLGLLLIISPVLAGATEHARWLPDRAAAQLYQATDPALSPVGGVAVAVGWIVLVGVAAMLRAVRSDP